MDPTEILSRLGTDNPPTDAELAEAKAEFGAQLANALDARNRDEAKNLKAARDVISEEQASRDEARAAEDAELAELAADLDPDDETEEAEEDEAGEEATVTEPEVLDLAAIRAASRNARARIDADAEPENPYPHVKVTGAGPASSVKVDHNTSLEDLGHIFSQHARGRDGNRQTLFSMMWDLPEDRMLGPEADRSTRIINAVLDGATTFEAIAAQANICGPLAADYRVPQLGSTERPVRDSAMVRFGGERGGIQYTPAPRLSTSGMAGAVSVFPDGEPDSPPEKPCLHVDCDCVHSETVEAITACLTVGNFLARFSPEQWSAALHQLAVAHARLGEDFLLARIDAGSIAVNTLTSPQGTIPGVLSAVGRGIAAIRSRDRRLDVGFRVILEGWLRNAMRYQFGVQDNAGNPNAVAIADQAINQWFAAYGASVTWTWDDTIFGAQAGSTALLDYPSTTNVRLYPEGTWGFIDGGTMDLGTEIIDLPLVQANQRAAFFETFEGALKRTAPCDAPGDDSLLIPVTVDDDCINVCAAAG